MRLLCSLRPGTTLFLWYLRHSERGRLPIPKSIKHVDKSTVHPKSKYMSSQVVQKLWSLKWSFLHLRYHSNPRLSWDQPYLRHLWRQEICWIYQYWYPWQCRTLCFCYQWLSGTSIISAVVGTATTSCASCFTPVSSLKGKAWLWSWHLRLAPRFPNLGAALFPL